LLISKYLSHIITELSIEKDYNELNKKTMNNTTEFTTRVVNVITDPHATQSEYNQLNEDQNKLMKESAKDTQEFVKKNIKN